MTAPAAVPSSEAVGQVTFASLPGGVALATTFRSFSLSGSNSGSSSSGGGSTGGIFTSGVPVVGIDSNSTAPLLLRSVMAGVHLQTVTVVLYRPGTTTRMEQWKFTDVLFKEVKYSQNGPPSKLARMTISWTYHDVTYATYQTNGTTVVRSYCWNTATRATCT